MSKCCGILGFIFGHHFQARYSETVENKNKEASLRAIEVINASTERLCALTKTVPDDQSVMNDGHAKIVDITKGTMETIYHCDVCTRCGTQVLFNHPVAPTPTRRLDTDI